MHPPRLGQDLVSIARLRAAVERHEAGFRRRVYTPAEWQACQARADRYAALASRTLGPVKRADIVGKVWRKY